MRKFLIFVLFLLSYLSIDRGDIDGARSSFDAPASSRGNPSITQGKEARDIEELKKILKGNQEDAQARYELEILLAEKKEALTYLEKAIQLQPNNLQYGNNYRMKCIKFQEYDRSINFLEKMVQEKPEVLELHLNLALAYVDKMPYQKLGIVGQGKLSMQSIRELNRVLEMDPKNWAGIYGRAMNHLYWPRALKHAPLSIADFQACLSLQVGKEKKPYFVLPYIALGDAYVKDRQYDKAGETWRKGVQLFPENSKLKERLVIKTNEGLDEFIAKERGLGIFIDTDLSFLWKDEK